MARRRKNKNRTRPRAQAQRPFGEEPRRRTAPSRQEEALTSARREEDRTADRNAGRSAARTRAAVPAETAPRGEGAERQVRPASRQHVPRRRRRRSRGTRGQNVEPFTFEEAKRTHPRPHREPTGRASEIIYRSLLAVMILAALFFIVSVFFEVRNVEVTGTDRYLPAYVEQISGIRSGDKLLFLNEFEISQKLFSKLPYVKAVKVRRRPPNTVVLDITERVPVAKLMSGDIAYIIDEDAYLLDYTVVDEDYQLPVINGASPVSRDRGKQLQFNDPLMLDSLRNVLSELVKSNWMDHISEINLEKIYSISFSYSNRFTVVLGDAGNLPYKLSLLEEVLSRLHETDQGVIDLSTPEMARFQPAIVQ